MTRREVEWTEEQAAWVLAAAENRRWRHACGGDLRETTSPDRDANNPQARHIYRQQLPMECHLCSALRRSENEYAGDNRALVHLAQLQRRDQRRR